MKWSIAVATLMAVFCAAAAPMPTAAADCAPGLAASAGWAAAWVALAIVAGLAVQAARSGSATQRRHALLIFDNCEHLVDAVSGLVERIVRSCPQMTVLATST